MSTQAQSPEQVPAATAESNDDRMARLLRVGQAVSGKDYSAGQACFIYAVKCAVPAEHGGYGKLTLAGEMHFSLRDGKLVEQQNKSFPTDEAEAEFRRLAGKSKSPARVRASVAKALGWTRDEVEDLRFLASHRSGSQAKSAVMAWTSYFLENFQD
jgi:hypothetical protein